MSGIETRRLGDLGLRIDITVRAEADADGSGLSLERLREYAALAQQTHGEVDGKPELWRFRRRSTKVDLSLRVRRRSTYVLICAVTVRRYPPAR